MSSNPDDLVIPAWVDLYHDWRDEQYCDVVSPRERAEQDSIDNTSCHAYISETGELKVVSFRYHLFHQDMNTGEEFFEIQDIWEYEVKESEIPALLKRLCNEKGEILSVLGSKFPDTRWSDLPCVPHIDDYVHGPTFGKLVVTIDPFDDELHYHLRAVCEWSEMDWWFDPAVVYYLDFEQFV